MLRRLFQASISLSFGVQSIGKLVLGFPTLMALFKLLSELLFYFGFGFVREGDLAGHSDRTKSIS